MPLAVPPLPKRERNDVLFNPSFNLFKLWNLPRNLYHPIYDEGRSDEDTIIGDRFDIFHFNHFGVNSKFFDSFFSSLLELIALCSTHTQNFDLLFHCLSLLLI